MKDFNPKVSIIIPVYNGANYMREAIDSALAQTYGNIEVVVVNDGSTDNGATRDIALSFGDRIKYFEKENGGVASALNTGIRAMAGDYFSWLSHDDVYLSEKIEVQVRHLDNMKDKDTILFGGWYSINDKSRITSVNNLLEKHRKFNLNRPFYPLFHGLIHGCSLLIPAHFFNDVGLFDESLKTTQDYDLWFKMLKKYSIYFHDEILIKYRVHKEQGSNIEHSHTVEANQLWKSFVEDVDEKLVHRFAKTRELYFLKISSHLRSSSLKEAYNSALSRYKSISHPITFSVIIPTYNRSYCITESIESVLQQTYNNFEVIVIDDGSNDNTKEVLEKYDSKIIYLNQNNRGVSAARNFGISKASGKYLAFLDSDDLWTPDHLEKHFNFLENNIQYAMSCNYAKRVNFDTGKIKGYIRKGITSEKEIKYPDTLFISNNILTTPSVVIRRCILDETGVFDENMDMCEDLDLWRRISMSFRIAFIPDYLTIIRERKNQFNPTSYFLKRKLFVEKAVSEDLSLSMRVITELYKELYRIYYNSGCERDLIIQDVILNSKKYSELLELIKEIDNNNTLKLTLRLDVNNVREASLFQYINLLLRLRFFRGFLLYIFLPVLKHSIGLANKLKSILKRII